MDIKSIESSFCYKYLINFVGIKLSTIESLISNDYDSVHSLMALDLDIDLNQLPNVSMGQKSILREALIKLRKELNLWKDCEMKSGPVVSAISPAILNSTPNAKTKEYPFVSSDQMFKELITTALMNISSEPLSESVPQPNVSSFADKESVDSGINGTDLEVIKLSPIKRGRPPGKPSNKKSGNKTPKTTENRENDQNLKLNTTSDDNEEQNKSMKRRKTKRKKFLYSLKRHPRSGRSKQRSGSLSENETNGERKVFINIDNFSKLEETTEESVITEVSESNQSTEVELKTKEKKSNVLSIDEDFDWKKKKPEILRLIKTKSNEIELKFDENVKEMSKFFKVIEMKGRVTPFYLCSLCLESNKYNILLKSSQQKLQNHLKSKQHENRFKELSKIKVSDDSDLSAEEYDVEEVKNKTVQKSKSENKSIEELLKLVTEPQIMVTKIDINFDESDKRWKTQLTDTNLENNRIVINNYEQIFRNTSRKASLPKPYKCDVKGCTFSASYPFSLSQHSLRKHNISPELSLQNLPKKSPIKKKTNSLMKLKANKNKYRKFSALGGMNKMVINYIDSEKAFNKSLPIELESNEPINSKCCSDSLLKANRECILNKTNEQIINNNINDKIINKIKEWTKRTTLLNDFF